MTSTSGSALPAPRYVHAGYEPDSVALHAVMDADVQPRIDMDLASRPEHFSPQGVSHVRQAAVIMGRVLYHAQFYLAEDCKLSNDLALLRDREAKLNNDSTLTDLVMSCFEKQQYQLLRDHPLFLAKHLDSRKAKISPERQAQESQVCITTFLEKLDARMRHYLLKDESEDFPIWSPWLYIEHDHGDFFQSLRIPNRNVEPCMLLHHLGQSFKKNDEAMIAIFTNPANVFLCNASGSGKTRLLLDGLCQHWGFYFVCKRSPIGSYDLIQEINLCMKCIQGFTENIWTADMDRVTFDKALHRSMEISEQALLSVLLSRLLVFRQFLQLAHELGVQKQRAKYLWTVLQTRVPLTEDHTICVFWEMAQCMLHAPTSFLAGEVAKAYAGILELIDGDELACVLDNAPYASYLHDRAFASKADTPAQDHECPFKPVLQPVLREIVRVFADHTDNKFRFIVSGNRLSMQAVSDALSCVAGKRPPFEPCYAGSAFEEGSSTHKDYLLSYIPPAYAQTPSGKHLIQRMQHWFIGRYHLTAMVLREMLDNCFSCPHRILNAFMQYASHIPTDALPVYLDDEPQIHLGNLLPIRLPLWFPDIDLVELHVIEKVRNAICSYIMGGRASPIPLKWASNICPDSDDVLLRYFAHIVNVGGTDAMVIDEPVSIYGAINWLNAHPTWCLTRYFEDRLDEPEPRPAEYQEAVAYLFCVALEKGTLVSHLVDFVDGTPSWANQTAKVVTFCTTDDGHRHFSPLRLASRRTQSPSARLGRRANTAEDVAEWLKNPHNVAFLLPDINIGTDTLCVLQLQDGYYVWVSIQNEYGAEAKSDTSYTNGNSQFYSSARPDLQQEMISALSALPFAANMVATGSEQFSMIRILTASPAKLLSSDALRDYERHPVAVMKLERLVQTAPGEKRKVDDALASGSLPTAKRRRRYT